VVIKASMSGVRRLFFVVKVRTKNRTALSSVYLCYLMFFLHVFWPGMTRQKLLFFKKPFKCPVLAASTLTPTLNCIFLMVSGVRIFDLNTGHLIGIKKIAVMVPKPLQMVWITLLRFCITPISALKIFLKISKYF